MRMRLIDTEELIENLLYDVALDEKILDDMDFVGNSRELIQFDKDCKQNAIEFLRNAPTIEIRSNCLEIPNNWIPCTPETMPECEQEVLICTKKKVVGKNAYIDSIITPALYEDGTMLEIDSKWRWEDIDYDKWDEESDCGIIPEGWWENRHFNPDDVYNNVVDREVVAWMPLPEPYKGEEE